MYVENIMCASNGILEKLDICRWGLPKSIILIMITIVIVVVYSKHMHKWLWGAEDGKEGK